jgi:UDP-glucose 4-epimerase/UDP-glucuronate decarboxylase
VLAKVLVTGGAGFIGCHLTKLLLQKKHDVTICDNLFRGKMDIELKEVLENKYASYVQCDLTERKDLDKLEDNYHQIYHLAAINGTKHFYEMPENVLKVNLLSSINVLERFKDNKSGKMLFSSSSENYAGTYKMGAVEIPTDENVPLCIVDPFNARNSYAASKITGELLFINYARKFKFKMSIVRFHNIYGPRMGFEHVIPEFSMRAAKKEDPFKIYGGEETRAFCFVSDAIEGTYKVMESDKTNAEIVHIGTQEEIKINELAKKIIKLANYTPKIAIKDAPVGSVKRRCPNIKKATKLVGYSPKVGIEEGIRKTFEWYKLKAEC